MSQEIDFLAVQQVFKRFVSQPDSPHGSDIDVIYGMDDLTTPTTQQTLVQQVQQQVASLLLYQAVLDDEIGQAFLHLLKTLSAPLKQATQNSTIGNVGFTASVEGVEESDRLAPLRAYGQWFRALATQQQTWQTYLLTQVLRADNPFSQQAQRIPFERLPSALVAAAQHDLQALQQLYACNGSQISKWVQTAAALATPPISWEKDWEQDWEQDWEPDTASNSAIVKTVCQPPIWTRLQTESHWETTLAELATHYRRVGVGLFATYRAFGWQAGKLVGIAHPDPIRLDHLTSYDSQKTTLCQNTEALLTGYPALHVLLYGSRGTGKSSLVKALLNEYGDRGLRLVEVNKTDLSDLPRIVDRLRNVPQSFIVFVDDLSFEEDDDAFKSLKVVLEGNLTARPQNVVVYATSNRRHLIREFLGDRPRPSDADEIHAWDTLQEKLSFSDRFGITLTFEPADQATYLAIVHHLAAQANLTLSSDDLDYRALQWATRHNGRSGRSARQFIHFLQATVECKQEMA